MSIETVRVPDLGGAEEVQVIELAVAPGQRVDADTTVGIVEVMKLMSDVMAHTITLHLLDAPGRVHRFMRKHPELAERIYELDRCIECGCCVAACGTAPMMQINFDYHEDLTNEKVDKILDSLK